MEETLSLPKVSILIPTYNRPEFLPLIGVNIVCQDYPKELLEVVIIDDHPTNQLFPNEQTLKAFQDQLEIPVTYLYKPQRHLSIGEKRNFLVKCAKHKILINFDDDDLYFPTYIRYSVTQLLKNKVGMVGSNQMLFLYPHLGCIPKSIGSLWVDLIRTVKVKDVRWWIIMRNDVLLQI
jgi:cellulose synthase/poly-beta-1,6-N-acetylglucosamine synthase-like glycosyltransferase